MNHQHEHLGSAMSPYSVLIDIARRQAHMLHHISLPVRDLAHSGAFYDAALGALGYRRVFEDDEAIGYGVEDIKDLLCLKLNAEAHAASPGFHLAFIAPDRAAVDRFHSDAIRVDGIDNGAPGLRPDYGQNYYAAFLIDPDGHRIEAVINR
jgi:catechol 2,3-dioxygenase-like lactoylglutathione lyase family enzyme